MSSARASLGSATADPGAIGLSLFGFALFLYGVQFVVYAGAAPGAATSSVATILCGFGLWLLGLYLLLTLGAENKGFAPDAVGWYAIALIAPVAFMAVPSILHRNAAFSLAFVALIGVLLFLGIGFLSADLAARPPVPPSASMLRVSGILAWAAAAALWYSAARIVLAIGNGPADTAAPATAGPSASLTSPAGSG